ncbi:aldehyde oxidoreductase molybdenum-binding subunit PaoC [Sphingomonas crusticola]|uniref:aldehyde oxidoreductase molybdenum-binding subunit PaoC n=1 Tax=Sphingomonas crusticola TaxID=1697973 RepID=UPI000E251B74|nr:aldehyde oxidoreductase molybdenum-binding subunit PaoC [Sphingomonas crusticola]
MSQLRFDQPAGPNPIDHGRVVGVAHDRVDGPRKVTGHAPYAYEYHAEVPNAAYGYIVTSGIAKGRISAIDTSEAEAAPGVLLVMTHLNAPKQGPKKGDFAPQLVSPEISYYHQPVALVVAETFEQARDAAHLVRISYAVEDGRFDLEQEKPNAYRPSDEQAQGPPDSHAGDFDAGYAAAPIKLDVTYTTPDQSHMMMEPHATIARWDDDRLTVWTSNQMVNWAVRDLAGTLLIPKDRVRVVSAFVGGGFGAKLWIQADATLAAIGARKLGRPVKLAIARPQIMNNTTHRPATIQRLRFGAEANGRLLAIGHESLNGNQHDGAVETATGQTKQLYGGKDRMTALRFVDLDLPVGNAMRAPGEAVGLLALECAMDELAEKVGVDPVELRIMNDVQYDPEKGPETPFSTRKLVECLRTGADKFGWSRRQAEPGRTRDGKWLIGYGVASAFRSNLTMDSNARVTLQSDGTVLVETDMTDIGTGSYTIIAQTAAEMMGVQIGQVEVRLADSTFPTSSGSGGSWGGNSSTAGVYAACEALRQQVAQKAGFNVSDVTFADGTVRSGGRSVPLAQVAGTEGIAVEGGIKFGDLTDKYAQASFGAHFCEVGVDSDTGEVRVRRMLTVAAAGRILNPKTARSQCLGGMTMGIGAALMEECVVDTRFGYFVNHDLAEYHVPVHADIPALEVIFLEEVDDKSSPMKAKGIGELGICGVGAAVANAVYNATGARIRDYPLTMDKILPHLT